MSTLGFVKTHASLVEELEDVMTGYEYMERLCKDDGPHNICSDIIESTFGYFKDRMSPNKNNGYTPLVLLIPLRLQLSTIEDCKNFNARTVKGIQKWKTSRNGGKTTCCQIPPIKEGMCSKK